MAYYAPDAGGLALPAAGAFAALLVFETLFRMRFPSLMRPGVSVARALAEMGYTGTIGLEGWASGDPTAAVESFRAAFTL